MDPLSSALPNLVTIELEKFSRCQHLPSFAQLASLRKLYLESCPGVEYMESSIGYKSAASPSQSSASVMPLFFPSLENLILQSMENMKGWWKGEERGEGSEIFDQPWQLDASNPRPLLPSFPNLTCSPAPLSPYVERLVLWEVDEKMVSMLKGQMATSVDENSSFSSLSPSFSTLPVSNLKTLEIKYARTLESFPRDCFKGLTSLQSLEIIYLPQLRSLSSSGLEHLTALRDLKIYDCFKLDLSDDEMMPWEALKSLRLLSLWHIPKMSSVPAGFQHLTALESLHIWGCGELGALSSSGLEHLTGLRELTIWICKELDLSDDEMMPWEALKSLRHLELRGIPKMSSVPAGFQHLTALEYLRIEECRKLGALPEWLTSLPSLQRIEMDEQMLTDRKRKRSVESS